jgi:formiminotetrahydrofolate cyclodeaminase
MLALVDDDAAAYDAVTAAYRMPKASDEEKSVRRAAIQQALRRATETPLDLARQCAGALQEAGIVARHGTPSASSDVGVGVELLQAALRGAILNVAINLDGLADQKYVAAAREETTRLSEAGAAAADLARRALEP